jgi:hypothetical protein
MGLMPLFLLCPLAGVGGISLCVYTVRAALSFSPVEPDKAMLALGLVQMGVPGLILVAVCWVLVGEIRRRFQELS